MSTNSDNGLDISTSRGFASWLAETGVSIAFSTDTAGKLFFVGLDGNGEVSVFERGFDRTGGLCYDRGGLLVATRYQIWRLENVLTEGPTADGYDALLVPQVGWVTGAVQAHDIAVTDDGNVLFANTMFSCLAAVSTGYSFDPVWRPPFIDALAAEQRCYLNGMATNGGQPVFVTMAAQTEQPRGWRQAIVGGGAVYDVETSIPVLGGLTLPASPRLYGDRLWMVESGSGYFGVVDPANGRFEKAILCPGFVRGLAFEGSYAVTSTSHTFGGRAISGLPVEENLQRSNAEARCALVVLDLQQGVLAHWMRIEGQVSEVQDVAILPGVRRPAAISLEGEEIQRILSIAPEASRQ
jgi:uncharacterized protein (TIGR03032 family)